MLCRNFVPGLLCITLSLGFITACETDNEAAPDPGDTGTTMPGDTETVTAENGGSDSAQGNDTDTTDTQIPDSVWDTATVTEMNTDASDPIETDTQRDSDSIPDSESDTASDTESDTDPGVGTDSGTPHSIVRSDMTYIEAPEVTEVAYHSFVASLNAFGIDLLDAFAREDENVVFSPMSIAMILGMTLPGARNNTADEMAMVLHNDLEQSVFHAAGNKLITDMRSRNIAPHPAKSEGEKSVQLSLVNAIWSQHNLSVESPFLDTLSVHYDSGIHLVDFITGTETTRLLINDWITENTNQQLTNFIPEGALTENTRMVLTNALHFFGSWHTPFKVSLTEDGDFALMSGTNVSVPLMHLVDSFTYDSQEGYQIVDVPYDGESLVMTIVLPEQGQFIAIRNLMNPDWLNAALETMNPRIKLELTLPRFNFLWNASLSETLSNLGMVDALDLNAADFSGISTTEPLFISDILHQAFIGVDEYGTEAAAATAAIVSTWSEPIPFTANRPFLFFIRDTITGAILFAGQVVDPSL